MQISRLWLGDYVPLPEDDQALAARLTAAGFAVEGEEGDGDAKVFDVDITSNRPDAMNHLGMAREVAAIYRRPLRAPCTACAESGPPAASKASVAIQDPDACVRYVGRVFTDVEVRPSPDWMRRRLELCGIRSINSLADLTNYVLLEIGQPTHAFDLDRLAGAAIVVRRARHGETLVTLDGEDRDLTDGHLAICDAEMPVALAGDVHQRLVTACQREVVTARIELEAQTVAWHTVRGHFEIEPFAKHCLLQGLDRLGYLAERLPAIETWEGQRPTPIDTRTEG